MRTAKFYLVGGAVRDQLLKLEAKDKDYCVEAESYDAMKQAIIDRGGHIFLEKPEYLTIRAKIPVLGATDYVLARKDGAYTDGRHPDKVEAGTIFDDLARRDFTVNAMALSENDVLIDPHGGQADLEKRVLCCVGDVWKRFDEDGLRMLRAMRFAITKGFQMDGDIAMSLNDKTFFEPRLNKIPIERIHNELWKCFRHDTRQTLTWLVEFSDLRRYLFDRTPLWLEPSLKPK